MTQYEKMTKTPVESLVARLAVPTIITMLITNIYNMADTAFVGRLGTSPSAAVGIVFGFMSILQAVGFMYGQGGGSIVSRLLGARKENDANITASTSVFFSFVTGVIISILSYINLNSLINFLGSTDTILPFAKTYIVYILCAAPFMTTTFTLNNMLRYEGKAMFGMIGMLTGAILNIILDPILMFGLNMGIAGAGLSTATSQTIGFFVLLSMFLTKKSELHLSIKNISFSPKLFGDIVGTGFPSLIRQGLQSIGTVVLNSLASVYGDVAISAMSIVSRISFFTFSIALGIGQGFQPVSAFNYGAGKYSRLRKAFRFSVLFAQLCMTVLIIVVLLFSGEVIGIFRNDPEVIEIGTRAVRILAVSQLCMPFCTMAEMQLQSTGQKLQASILSAMKSGLIFIPLLIILNYFRGLYGIEEAQPISLIISLIPSIFFAYNFFKKLPEEDEKDKI